MAALNRNPENVNLMMSEIPKEIHDYYTPDRECESAVRARDGRIIIEFKDDPHFTVIHHVWQHIEGKWVKL